MNRSCYYKDGDKWVQKGYFFANDEIGGHKLKEIVSICNLGNGTYEVQLSSNKTYFISEVRFSFLLPMLADIAEPLEPKRDLYYLGCY